MKRYLSLALLLLLVATGCSANGNPPPKLDRETVLPCGLVSVLAGSPMKPLQDVWNESAGEVQWSWEEMGGMPKLLIVEIYYPPSDCDGLYSAAESGSSGLTAPNGVSACYDGRAAHIRFGNYYVRVSTLGFTEDRDAVELIISRLATQLANIE